MKKLFTFLVMLGFLSFASFSFAASWNVTFGWDAHTDSDVLGYRIYMSNISGDYTFGEGNELLNVLVPDTQGTVTLSDGSYYFVITAYDEFNEALPSNEVPLVLDSTKPDPVTGFKVLIIIKNE